MSKPALLESAMSVLKRQKLVASCALVVGLTLVFAAHAPAAPVVIGCTATVLASAFRSWSNLKGKSVVGEGS